MKLAAGQFSPELADEILLSLDQVIAALGERLFQLPADELLAFDRILERKFYDLDRREVHDETDGSDDGFLYCRGFIVAVGREYYDAVNVNPMLASAGLECEDICYL